MIYLFVCLANQDRSPIAERICREIARERGLDIEVGSAGLDSRRQQLTKEIADRADKIFVMEPYMERIVIEDYGQRKEKVSCLNVDDDYDTSYDSDINNLERIFGEKLAKLL